MNKLFSLLLSIIIFASCSKDDEISDTILQSNFISAVDISTFPEIANSSAVFYDLDGNENEFLDILKDNGVNTIRLKLFVNPINENDGFNAVKQFSQTLKAMGFKTWISLHYSDTWADPSSQEIPSMWQGISFNALKDSIFNYTQKVVVELEPNYLQIGNEINSGILLPYGDITTNPQGFLELLTTGVAAVRANSNKTQLILHFAGFENSDWFFNQVKIIDFDIIGLSYYPIWHGKSLNNLKLQMHSLSESFNKKIVIAETAYPFTLEWNDWTMNIVGLEEQLILPEFPATAEGQRAFVKQIRNLSNEVENGIGFCYWGAELIAWNGHQSSEASPWENQALFDFNNRALPVLRAFSSN